MSTQLTIVMYHYVREIRNSQYPNIKGLEFSGFRRQLDYLQRNFTIVDAGHVLRCLYEGAKMAENACLLTFDDGYKDHYKYVFPELMKRKLKGCFFPPASPILKHSILDVNKIHYMLACCKNTEKLLNDLHRACRALNISDEYLKICWKNHGVKSDYDEPAVAYIKRMLQFVLDRKTREIIVDDLFDMYVSPDRCQFSKDLYFSKDEAIEMINNGMCFGNHGDTHIWLDKEDRVSQAEEIDKSLELLKSLGASIENWVMCYPYGGYNNDTLALLKERKCGFGVTTVPKVAVVNKENALLLPRFDTNDFPQ